MNQIDELMEDCKHPVQGGDPMLSSHSHMLSPASHSHNFKPKSSVSETIGLFRTNSSKSSTTIVDDCTSCYVHHHNNLNHHKHHSCHHRLSESVKHSEYTEVHNHDSLLLTSSQQSLCEDQQSSADLSGGLINDDLSSLVDDSHSEPMLLTPETLEIDL